MLSIPGSGEVLGFTDTSGNNVVPLHDALGSTMGLVNNSGQIQNDYGYSAFGSQSQSGTPYYYPYLYTGHEWSDIGGVSQQYYTWARLYSPGLRRFIAADPAGFAGSGTNLFAYVGDDPIDLSDPTGLSGFFAWVGELFTGGGLNGDVAAGAACSNFFTCVAAIAGTIGYTIYGALAVSGGGGGGHASLPSVPPALLGAQLAQQLARHGFTPQYEVYDWPSPGTHFDPRYLITIDDRPVPSGKTGQGQKPPSSTTSRPSTLLRCAYDFAHVNLGLGLGLSACIGGSLATGPAAPLTGSECAGVVGAVEGPPTAALDYLLIRSCVQELR